MSRQRKPRNLVIIEGNRGKRPLREEPDYRVLEELPPAPRTLGRHGRAEWRRVGKELVRTRLLTEVSLGMLESYCRSYQEWRECIAWIDKHGTTIDVWSKDGSRLLRSYEAPRSRMAREHAREMRYAAGHFGLTPATASKAMDGKRDLRTPQQKLEDSLR